MLASIVIACYNHEPYIRGCLYSILQQACENMEIVIIDDCSTDNNFAIAQEFFAQPAHRSRFRRVVCERNAVNLGASGTWNRAVARANGDLIFLLNSDDYFHPKRVETFISDWRQRSLYFGFSFTAPVDAWGRDMMTAAAAEIKYRPRNLVQRLPVPSWGLLDQNIAVSTGNFVFTKPLWEAVGGFADLKYCHDWSFALRALTWVEPSILRVPLYYYRLHQENSFLALADRADEEAHQCYRDYAHLTMMQKPLNSLCLSPHNQGAAFLTLAQTVPVFQQWLLSYYYPYQSYHRTVEVGRYTTGAAHP